MMEGTYYMTDSNLKGSYDGMTENKHTLNDAISLMGDITQFSTRDKSNTVNTNSSQLVASAQYDVKKYGAIGDGITNDTIHVIIDSFACL